MKNNKLIIAAAGSGKTTYLVNEALKNSNEKILITTYTEANEAEIRQKIIQKKNCIPSNVTVQTWFSFLLQHGVRPFQGALHEMLFDNDIKGMLLVNSTSAVKYNGRYGPVVYKEEEEFEKHYFTKGWKIFSDKISKFIYKCNTVANGDVVERVSRIFSHFYIDEVQDLAGYDLELIKLLLKSTTSIMLVGDPRQVTYLTHHESKNRKYKDGKIKQFVQDHCKSLIKADDIDETTLNVSHRNNDGICEFSSKLYPEYKPIEPCKCDGCRLTIDDHNGVYLVREVDVEKYLLKYNPVQLRWNISTKTNPTYSSLNFGESKGKTFNRVIIYPTKPMCEWISDNPNELKNEARAKLYVALTRARYSAAIIYNYNDNEEIDGSIKYTVD